MTELSEQEFLMKLYEVTRKLSGISKTQSYRFKKEWDDFLKEYNPNPHLIRQFSVEKEKFLEDISYRIQILDTIRLSFDDGFHSIKSLLSTLYNHYLNDSPKLRKEFSDIDQLQLKYFIAKEILGNLFQYNQLDHESVPLKYNILAREYLMIKLQKGRSEKDIKTNLKKINLDITMTELRKYLKNIIDDGFLNKTKKGKDSIYKLAKEIELSDDGKKKFNQLLRPLVDWPTLFWRSYYNIREINVTIKEGAKNPESLNKILLKAATQGYLACHYVFENLKKYYEENQ